MRCTNTGRVLAVSVANAATAEGPVPEPAMGTGGTIELPELLG